VKFEDDAGPARWALRLTADVGFADADQRELAAAKKALTATRSRTTNTRKQHDAIMEL